MFWQLIELIMIEGGDVDLTPSDFMNLAMITYAKNPDLVDEVAR